MPAPDRSAFRSILQRFSADTYFRLRAVSMTALAHWGSEELGRLKSGLADSHVEVRRSAARALTMMRTKAAPALDELISNLDPIRGAAPEVSAALVAIGGPAVAAMIRAKSPKTAPWASYYEEVARAAENRSNRSLDGSLAKHFLVEKYDSHLTLTGQDMRVSYLAVAKSGKGLAFDPARHRMKLTVTQAGYRDPVTAAGAAGQSVEVYQSVSSPWDLLRGIQAAAQVTLYVSPGVYQGPHEPTVYQVSVAEVCEPKYWKLFRGFGIIGPVIFEVRCAS